VNIQLNQHWQGDGGFRQVLRMALPLILSTSAFTVQMFIDRVFLMWYSSDAMAGAMYAGMVTYTIYSVLSGTALYVNTFVAQYDGAKQHNRVGPSVWQGIYFSVIAGLLMASLSPFSQTFVYWAGHAQVVQPHETIYMRILMLGAMPGLLSSALSCFYTGRGKMWTVMWIDFASTLFNLIFDYLLIFGKFGFPRWGVAGAAWASVGANVFATLLYIVLIFRQTYFQRYAITTWRFDRELFMRLMRFGLPSGLHFMLDMIGFTLFLTFVGRINALALTATAMAFQINTLAFMPMTGFSTAVSTLVGQALGANEPELAVRSTWSATYMTMGYMLIIALGYCFVPDLFMYPFGAEANVVEFEHVAPLVRTLLLFVAFYCLFDTGNLIFSAAVKGAGDTRFVMWITVVFSFLILVMPSYFAVKFMSGMNALYGAWVAATAYICILATVFLLRFLQGKWKSMRVIEIVPVPVHGRRPSVPTPE
jgi:MATE family multidrug resistance protein